MARLLVVEDQTDVGDVLTEALRTHGFDVVTVGDATSARAALNAEKFDLMIADMVIPGRRDGELANDAWAKGLQVVLMSGHPDRIAEAHGRFAFLAKPFSLDALFDVVERALTETTSAADAEERSGSPRAQTAG